MSLEVFGDDGDVEDLSDLAIDYGYMLRQDGKWRNDEEGDDDDGLTDEQMWQYVQDRRISELEDDIERP